MAALGPRSSTDAHATAVRPYDPDPMRASLPLDPDEVAGALAYPKSVKRPDAVAHLLRRAEDTLRAERDARLRLTNELQNERTLRMARPSAAAGMSPMAAAQYLSPEQIAALQQGTYSQQLRDLVAVLREIESVRADHVRALARLNLAVEALKDDPQFGPRLSAALAALPAPGPEVAAPRQALNLDGQRFTDEELDRVAPRSPWPAAAPAPAAAPVPAAPAAPAAPKRALPSWGPPAPVQRLDVETPDAGDDLQELFG